MSPPRFAVAALAAALAFSIGCASAPLAVRPVRQALDLRLDPATSRLEATSATELTVEGSPRRGRVDLLLHPDLVVTSVTAEGATLAGHRLLPPKKGEGDAIQPATLRLQLKRPAADIRLDIAYQGKLWQDVAAGEKEGQVHNFAVQAHVGKEGVYLEPAGYWYPQIEPAKATSPDEQLTPTS